MEDCTGTITLREKGEKVLGKEAYRRVLSESEDFAKQIVSETRRNYIKKYQDLLDTITVPKILFWFSEREPDYKDDFTNVKGLFNDFPQMINQEILEEIAGECDDLVVCKTDRGFPQQLVSRFTGKPVFIIEGQGKKTENTKLFLPITGNARRCGKCS